MTAMELIMTHEAQHPSSYYFSRNSLKFFGERISDMRVLVGTVRIEAYDGEHECYVLSRLQRKAPGGPRRSYAYFDVNTFEDVHPKDTKGE